jgi:hypothetical protein
VSDRDQARWALRDDRKMSKIAKLVWLMLDSRGEDPWPSIGKLAADCGTGTTRNTVKRGLAELEAAGWVRIIQRVADDGGATSHRYQLACPYGVSPGNGGVGSSRTRGVGLGETHPRSIADPEDQQEDQQVEDQQENPCTHGPAEPAGTVAVNESTPGDWRQEKLTCWVTAAHLACRFQVITGSGENRQAESKIVRWLTTTYRPLPDGTNRTPLQFTVFLVKVFLAARLPIDALTGMKAEGELDTTSSADDAAELLTLVRKADKDALDPADYAVYERLTGAAAREALWCLTTSDAITAGISLPEQPKEPS